MSTYIVDPTKTCRENFYAYFKQILLDLNLNALADLTPEELHRDFLVEAVMPGQVDMTNKLSVIYPAVTRESGNGDGTTKARIRLTGIPDRGYRGVSYVTFERKPLNDLFNGTVLVQINQSELPDYSDTIAGDRVQFMKKYWNTIATKLQTILKLPTDLLVFDTTEDAKLTTYANQMVDQYVINRTETSHLYTLNVKLPWVIGVRREIINENEWPLVADCVKVLLFTFPSMENNNGIFIPHGLAFQVEVLKGR